MSHELRTPLNSIIGFSRVILKGIDGPINDTQAQDLSAIYNSGQHLLSLINNILDLSKIDSGKMELKVSEINISDIINSAMTTATGLAKDKPIKFKQIVPPDLPKVQVDPTRIRQVLINFLSNACKFTDEGLITIEATSRKSPEGDPEIMVTVSDTGQGIDVKDRAKLFQPFSQVDDSPTRRAGGTGLGLSISRSLIDLHGGRIGLLSSEVGKGSTFYFTLPLPQPDKKRVTTGMLRESPFGKLQPDQEIASQKRAEEVLPQSPEPERIAADLPLSEPFSENVPGTVIPTPNPETLLPELLIASSQTALLSKIEKLVHPIDFRTSNCTELDKVVDRTLTINPYAIIVDLNSTQFKPWNVVKVLKTTKSTKYIPMILIGVLERREKGLRVGAEDFLVKPIIQDEMEDIVARLESSSRTNNLLLVDDNPENIRKFQNLVKNKKNIQLITSKTGEEGMKLMATLQPDRVIFNPLFNETDIYTLLETMYTDFRLRNIGITFMTGIDITEKQAATINQFNQMIFQKINMSDVPLLKALENSIKK